MYNMKPRIDLNTPSDLCSISLPDGNDAGTMKKTPIKDNLEACFYFNSDGVTLESLSNKNFDDQIKTQAGKPATKDLALKNSNYKEFEKLSECILNMEERNIPIVYILGKTDPKTPKGINFSDNYQLSSARAGNLYLELTRMLSRNHYNRLRDVQWRIFPVSSEDTATLFPGDREQHCIKLGDDPLSNHRVVEVLIESSVDVASADNARRETSEMQVMDYMYFSLYTITTTGYGDIKPITPYAKLICSLENIIEVYFLVIFLNVLISFKDLRMAKELSAEIQKGLGLARKK